MEANTNKIKTKVDAEIISSDTHMFTVAIKVTEKDSNKPVTKGKIEIMSKKGKVIGTGKISKEGTVQITSSITKKNYVLTIHYEGSQHTYDESKTKINFKKEYMFYKTSFYLWLAIISVLIGVIYIIALNSLIISQAPNSILSQFGYNFLPYITMSNETAHAYLANLHYVHLFINILVWVLIVSFVVASVYAAQFNSNFHNIIRKNVTNHSIFQHYFSYIITALLIITGIVVILGYAL